MKTKNFLIVAALLLVLGVLTTGVAYAQGMGGRGPVTGGVDGPLHTYIVDAYASALGMTSAALEARLDAGETAYNVALSQGIPAAQIPTLLADARSKALDAAAKAGVITTDQATWMKSRGMGQGAGQGYGMGAGTGPCNGTGQPIGQGMGRGGRWQQSNP